MKPKINKLYMHNLSNGAHCNFMDAISAKYNGKEVLRTRLKNELATFDSMLEKEFESFGLPRKSQLSDSIWQNDRIRRDGLLGLFDLVKAHLYLRKGTQYEAAANLKQFMKDCRLSPRASINELSGMLTAFLDNLEEVHPGKIELIGGMPFIEQITEANNAVYQDMALRNKERSGREKGAMRKARRETDLAYNALMRKTEALYLVDTENITIYSQTIDEINAQVKHYKEQELTSRTRQQKEPEADPTTE